MGWLAKLTSKAVQETGKAVGAIISDVKNAHLSKRERDLQISQLMSELETKLVEQATTVIEAKQKIMVAELQQGDNYTKRARPTIVYAGLAAAFIDAVGTIDFTMPSDFWYVWGGVCGVYAIGRTAEKRGWGGKVTKTITGSTMPTILED